MKRVLTILLITLLILPVAIAQAVPNNEEEIPIRGVNDINQGVENDILIPNSLSYIARVVFRLEGPVYLSQFIILSCLLLIVFMFGFNMARTSDFPGGKISSLSVVTIIILIGSASGGLRLVSDIYLNALYRIPLFDEYNFLGLTFTIIFFIFLIYLMRILGEHTKKEAEFEEGYKEGIELTRAQRFVKRLAGADR